MLSVFDGCLQLSRRLALGVLVAASLSGTAFAVCAPNAMPADKVAAFKSNPSSLLTGPGGTNRAMVDMVEDVRNLVKADATALPLVIALLKANPPPSTEQQGAIGTGLGHAANDCIRVDPDFAALIQTEVVGAGSQIAELQYRAVRGERQIGGIGAGAGSLGAGGGQVNPLNSFSGGGGLFPFLASSTANSPTNYFGGSAGGISFIGTPTSVSVSQ